MIWLSCLKERSTLWFPEKMSMKIGWGWRGNITTVRIKNCIEPYIILMASLLAKLIWFFITSWIAGRGHFSHLRISFVCPQKVRFTRRQMELICFGCAAGSRKTGALTEKVSLRERPTRKTWVQKENQFWLLLTTQFQVFWWISDALQQN